jgi:hypothetical protein
LPTAANDLAAYFSAAAELDLRLKAAAALANGNIGTTQVAITKATLDAIAAADPSSAAGDIPAGLTPKVLLPVLTVQSDLESRYYAFRGFVFAQGQPGYPAIPISGDSGRYLMGCLADGRQAATSFQADLAAAVAEARAAPPAAKVAPNSRAAADLALWLHNVLGENSGCMECGGYRVTALLPITWGRVGALEPGMNHWDGHMGGMLFYAHYMAGKGWTVGVNACAG